MGSLAEYTTTGGATTSTDYLYAAGKLVAEAVTSGAPSTTTLTYLVTNAQGTPLEALDGSGAVTASRLYTPYGASRYTSGAFPTSYGYTGQRNDATSGLDYYGARYYDPAIAQFTSADTVLQGSGFSICGLNRYSYVKGNPATLTDPSGNCPQRPTRQKVAKFLLETWAVVSQVISLFAFKFDVGQYSGTNRSGGGSPETQVETTYDPNKNVAGGGPGGDCDNDPPKGIKHGYVYPETGVVTGLESNSQQRAARNAARPAQNYGPEGANGVRGAQVEGKNAGAPKHLPDGSWTAHLEAVNRAAYGPSSMYIPSLQAPAPAGVPSNIWLRELLDPWTIGLAVWGSLLKAGVEIYYYYRNVGAEGDPYGRSGAYGRGGVYDQAGIPSVAGGLDMGGGNRDVK